MHLTWNTRRKKINSQFNDERAVSFRRIQSHTSKNQLSMENDKFSIFAHQDNERINENWIRFGFVLFCSVFVIRRMGRGKYCNTVISLFLRFWQKFILVEYTFSYFSEMPSKFSWFQNRCLFYKRNLRSIFHQKINEKNLRCNGEFLFCSCK